MNAAKPQPRTITKTRKRESLKQSQKSYSSRRFVLSSFRVFVILFAVGGRVPLRAWVESHLPDSQKSTYTRLFPITPSSRDVRRVIVFSRNDSSESKSLQRRTNELADACS